jgi:hypothetical protein
VRKKNKKPGKVENSFLKPRPKPSHKKRNAVILGGALALIIAGASVKTQDEK